MGWMVKNAPPQCAAYDEAAAKIAWEKLSKFAE
jgi:hypothetical protein